VDGRQGRVGTESGLRAVVADGNALARRGLAAVLSDAGAVIVGDAADTESALRWVAREAPEVLVVALDLPGRERGHVVAIARDRWPGLAIVALSERASDDALLDALELGASAYLPKTTAPEQVVATVAQAAATPGAFLSQGVPAARARSRHSGPRLTPREEEVLRLAAEGLTVRGISARLYVSEATTRSHLTGIYHKLGVSSRSQAVLRAERLGMLR
jgi:DNA-binding NarL/FixJ family response regulator